MKDYSVLLLYPDYLAASYGQETYLAHVTAPSAFEATELAKEQVTEDNEDGDPDDFFVLLVCEGHIEDLKP